MLVSCFAGVGVTADAATVDKTATSASTDPQSSIQGSAVLHCFNWSYNTIRENLSAIKDAGYTAVQTSPVHSPKDYNSAWMEQNTQWWKLYQPTDINVADGNNWLGTKAELRALCTAAESMGMKVICDIVYNHLANVSTSYGNQMNNISSQVSSEFRNNYDYWHINYNWVDDYNRYNMTMGSLGMPDLNTGNSYIQQRCKDVLIELIGLGVDGFRFDAAKHIELPTDGDFGSNFWPTIINGSKASTSNEIFYYGELLGDIATSPANYTAYMNITDTYTSDSALVNANSGNASGLANSSYSKGESASQAVLWAESHDTYMGTSGTAGISCTKHVPDSSIIKAWAILGSRADSTALFFARPNSTMGLASSNTTYKCKEVAEVNKFKNFFEGQSEYLSSSGSVAYNERGSKGVVISKLNGGGTVNIPAKSMASGTYEDQVTGNKFTVANGVISGTVGSSGVAVVYNPVTTPSASINPGSKSFTTDTLSLTLNYMNATSGQYSVSGGSYKTFTNGQTITIGSGVDYGTVITVSVKATDGTTTSTPVTYSYTKKDPSLVQKVRFDNTAYNWSQVYAYIYDESGSTTIQNTSWPGQLMSVESSTGHYVLDIDESLANGQVIFTEGSSSSNRYPADGAAGLALGGKNMILLKDYEWTEYTGQGASGGADDNIGDSTGGTTGGSTGDNTGDNTGDSTGDNTDDSIGDGSVTVYFDNSSYNWSQVYAYIYDESGNTVLQNAAWPGQLMTLDSATGYYKITVDSSLANGQVIFAQSANTVYRYPADGAAGLYINNKNMILLENYVWTEYTGDGSSSNSGDGSVTVYFDNTSYNWSNVYVYIYNDTNEMSAWPGNLMSYDSTLNLYKYTVPAEFANGRAIFTESASASTNRYPANNQAGLEIGRVDMIFEANKVWREYTPDTSTLSLSASEVLVDQGATTTLTASNARGAVSYTSSDPSIATVAASSTSRRRNASNLTANVTAVSEGSAIITAKDAVSGQTAKCKITVSADGTITLSETEVSMVAGKVNYLTEDAPNTVTWTSSDPSVVSVARHSSAKGKLTATKAGTAIITAYDSKTGKTATCKVTVTLGEITLSTDSLSLETGKFGYISEDSANKVTWTSSDESVATVSRYNSAKGKVVAKAAGTAIITATDTTGASATCKVTVKDKVVEVVKLALDLTEISMKAGKTAYITENTRNKVIWTSSDTSIAKVSRYSSAKGKVTAVKPGTVTITATDSVTGETATCKVTITSDGFKVSPTTVTMSVGTFRYIFEDSKNTVTWSSSDTSIATVSRYSSAQGKIVAKKPGTVIITATDNVTGDKATCKVIIK